MMHINSDTHLSRKLAGVIKIEYKLENLTGLLIRMPVSAQVYRIGGADQYPMVTTRKYVINSKEEEIEVPYIPGSSLKGRMRSLAEEVAAAELYSTDGKIWMHARYYGDKEYNMQSNELIKDIVSRCVIDEVFGSPALHLSTLEEVVNKKADKNLLTSLGISNVFQLYSQLAQTRLLVDDIFPDVSYVKELVDKSFGKRIAISDFLEEKSENRIDRVTSAADPRTVVRVKPGVVFSGTLRLLVFDIDRGFVKRNLLTLLNSMKLVEETYLGGSGSRGYGKVRFKKLRLSLIKTSTENMLEELVGEYETVDEILKNIESVAESIEKKLFA